MVSDINFDCFCRYGISRIDFNFFSDFEFLFLEIILKMLLNFGNMFMNKGKECDLVFFICCFYEIGSNY